MSKQSIQVSRINSSNRSLKTANFFHRKRFSLSRFLERGLLNDTRVDIIKTFHIYEGDDIFLCMRTTIEISNELLRQAKKRAADEGAPLRKIIEEALRFYLGNRTRNKRYELKWRTERGRILPGVRLDDRDALFDLMEGRT